MIRTPTSYYTCRRQTNLPSTHLATFAGDKFFFLIYIYMCVCVCVCVCLTQREDRRKINYQLWFR